jgi:hypothetical protein
MDPQAKILKFPHETGVGSAGASQEEAMPAESQRTGTVVLTPPAHAPAAEPPPPVWMQRFFLVTTVLFCLWVGFVLAVLPWQPAWTENALVSNYPNLKWILGTGFVRGLASGLGLVDLWIGISEAVRYRDRR